MASRFQSRSEPTFRQSLITKIKWELRDGVIDCFEDIIQLCVRSNNIAKKRQRCSILVSLFPK